MIAKGRYAKALVNALFVYGQFFVSILGLFFVTPLALRTLGHNQYGTWLSGGEVLGYLLMLDFGVPAVLPWLLARADGERDHDRIRKLMAHALFVSLGLVVGLVVLALSLGSKVPAMLHLAENDWQALRGPLVVLGALMLLNLPLNVFFSLLQGLQSSLGCGLINVTRAVLSSAITLALLLYGAGLYSFAAAYVVWPVGGFAALLYARQQFPDLLRRWPSPNFREAGLLFREGIGTWLGSSGVQMLERSSALLLAALAGPASVPVLVCTSRGAQVLTQLAWTMPDSALVGLSQMTGENKPARLKEVSFAIIRLQLLTSSLMASLVFALNPAFVRMWVGPALFGGLQLNTLLGLEVLLSSIVHSLATIVAVNGHRLAIGLSTLLQGILYLGLGVFLFPHLGLNGILLADLIAPFASTLPVSLFFLNRRGITRTELGLNFGAVFLCVSPCLVCATAYGLWRVDSASFPELVFASLLIIITFVVSTRHMLAGLLPDRVRYRWLTRLLGVSEVKVQRYV